MPLLAAILTLELCLRVVLPYLADEVQAGPMVGIALLLLMQLATIGAAHYSVLSDTLWDDIGWLVGASIVMMHGGWHVDAYDTLYVPGEPASIILICVAYLMMPLAVGMMPLVALGPLPVEVREALRRQGVFN